MTSSLFAMLTASVLTVSPMWMAAGAPGTFQSISSDGSCRQIADAVRTGATHEAYASFWLEIAALGNDLGAELPDDYWDAWGELLEELQLVHLQYQGRLIACDKLRNERWDPTLHPSEFTSKVDNIYLPLVPGRTLVYERVTSAGLERVEQTTLAQTRIIGGFECRTEHVIETINGELVEDTKDWIAQHQNGDVWYFGETAKIYENGFLESMEGSWRVGRDGAKPGILMLQGPKPGDLYRQEYLINRAEDLIEVVSVDQTVTVAYGTFHHCVVTQESSALEPDDDARKYYAPGVGLVLELDLNTGDRLELTDIIQ